MRLLTFSTAEDPRPRPGIVLSDGVVDIDAVWPVGPGQVGRRDVLDLVVDGAVIERVAELAAGGSPVIDLADVVFHSPVLTPGKVIGVGLNYRSHAEEQGAKIPKQPILFAMWGTSVTGHRQGIPYPEGEGHIDFEAELAVVIGRSGRDIAVEDAMSYVLGYTCTNDVTDRAAQFAERQWVRSKSYDGFCPLGPWLVPAAEIERPDRLGVRMYVNDEKVQDGSTEELIFDLPTLISFASRSTTLEPGDVIATGTPAGVGFARTPPLWLKVGDRMRVEIDGIGSLENELVPATVAAVS